MAVLPEKINVIQKPFRCPEELDIRINRAKGALMLRSGARISDNQFILELLEMGLEVMHQRIGSGVFDSAQQNMRQP